MDGQLYHNIESLIKGLGLEWILKGFAGVDDALEADQVNLGGLVFGGMHTGFFYLTFKGCGRGPK